MISNFFIDRPIFASVVSAFIVIAGLAAFRALPVSMYPNIAPPQVNVATSYPGASADVIAETVATPLEQALNGVEALEKLLGEPADLLIVDVNMPQMDGFTFLRSLRQQAPPIASIPALVISTEAGPHDRQAARSAGWRSRRRSPR